MFSMCSELTPRARIPDTRIPQLMQPCQGIRSLLWIPAEMIKRKIILQCIPNTTLWSRASWLRLLRFKIKIIVVYIVDICKYCRYDYKEDIFAVRHFPAGCLLPIISDSTMKIDLGLDLHSHLLCNSILYIFAASYYAIGRCLQKAILHIYMWLR